MSFVPHPPAPQPLNLESPARAGDLSSAECEHRARALREEGRRLLAEQARITADLRERVWPQASAYEALALVMRKRETK